MLAVVFVAQGYPAPEQANHGVLLRVEFVISLQQHLESCDDQKSSEDVDHPMEILKQSSAGSDKNRSHEQRADNPPKKNSMLIDGRGREVLKDHEKDEEIIDAEGFFDDITGEKFESFLLSPNKVDSEVKNQGQ